ncbi:hypothetical protein LshimejAT787_0506230 [Lyophyllum shimeji]|uniref:Uncharacterized protein n=1 Tax=Lyophyllum shimeji TaxID=47721 RepID=A0A9P3PMS0_LYOSH|nr:hypothetical protein LshimejAT787_0506230 [Lyophyllum shimeji]
MHRSLQIPEIVKLICEQLEVINPQTSEQFKCLAAFLRTCRAFHEPALSIVWSNVDSLVPLLKCMPRDLWMIEKETFKFNREIRPADCHGS